MSGHEPQYSFPPPPDPWAGHQRGELPGAYHSYRSASSESESDSDSDEATPEASHPLYPHLPRPNPDANAAPIAAASSQYYPTQQAPASSSPHYAPVAASPAHTYPPGPQRAHHHQSPPPPTHIQPQAGTITGLLPLPPMRTHQVPHQVPRRRTTTSLLPLPPICTRQSPPPPVRMHSPDTQAAYHHQPPAHVHPPDTQMPYHHQPPPPPPPAHPYPQATPFYQSPEPAHAYPSGTPTNFRFGYQNPSGPPARPYSPVVQAASGSFRASAPLRGSGSGRGPSSRQPVHGSDSRQRRTSEDQGTSEDQRGVKRRYEDHPPAKIHYVPGPDRNDFDQVRLELRKAKAAREALEQELQRTRFAAGQVQAQFQAHLANQGPVDEDEQMGNAQEEEEGRRTETAREKEIADLQSHLATLLGTGRYRPPIHVPAL
ncbi:hypothetical protein C8R47DRAFT_1240622 [Mycena vitilis]|nr:hypothetical protein C8R47DRAFT_1240622 [Mycena vitilis]